MKKLFLCILLSLIWCNAGFANEIEFSKDSINDNITNYDWEIYKNEFIKLSANQTIEIYTLEKQHKNEFVVLKCQVSYYVSSSSTSCSMP